MLRAGHDNLSSFKIHDIRLSSRQADNQLAGKSLSHMQTLGYQGKMCPKYVIMVLIAFMKATIEICMHRYPLGLALWHLEFFLA